MIFEGLAFARDPRYLEGPATSLPDRWTGSCPRAAAIWLYGRAAGVWHLHRSAFCNDRGGNNPRHYGAAVLNGIAPPPRSTPPLF